MEQAALNAFTFPPLSVCLCWTVLPTIEALDLTMNPIHKVFFPLSCQLGLPKWPQRAVLIGQSPSLSLAWLGVINRRQHVAELSLHCPPPALLLHLLLIRCYIIAAMGWRRERGELYLYLHLWLMIGRKTAVKRGYDCIELHQQHQQQQQQLN